MKIVLDSDRCTGHGRCYALAPDVYDADDEGHCVVRHEVVPVDAGGQGPRRCQQLPRRSPDDHRLTCPEPVLCLRVRVDAHPGAQNRHQSRRRPTKAQPSRRPTTETIRITRRG